MRSCPKCKTSDYNNRYFSLLVNECGHSLCKNCVETLFVRQTGPCPVCGKNLKKSTFWEQIFDDPLVEKQTFYRKKLQKIFNLKPDDFSTLRGYNDYLEKLEIYVNNLTFDSDLERTREMIEQFQADHADLIQKNRNKPSKDDEWIQKQLDDERKAKELSGQYVPQRAGDQDRKFGFLDERPLSKKRQEQDAKDVIAELMASDADATQIVGRRRYEALKNKEEQELKRAAVATKRAAENFHALKLARRQLHTASGDQQEIFPLSSDPHSGRPYVYVELAFEGWAGPAPPSSDCDGLASRGYLRHIKPATGWQLAGGYVEALGCVRALTEARCDLFL